MMHTESGEQVRVPGSMPMRCDLERSVRITAAQGHGLIAWLMAASRSLCISRWSWGKDAMD